MRVAIVIHGYYPRVGGAETQLKALVPYLQNRGLDMHIITRRYEPGLPARECIDGVDVYRMPVPGPRVLASLVFTFSAFLQVLRLRPQVVHAHEFISPATVALLAKRWLGVPIVVTSHRSGPIGDVQKMVHKAFGTKRLDALRKQTNKFVVISNEIWDELRSIGVPEDKLVRIANGVDVNRFAPPPPDQKSALRAQAGFAPQALIAVFTGRLVPEKRLDLLIGAWPAVKETFPNAELLIVGVGSEEQQLKARAGEGVHFMGSTTDVLPYLQMADVFVLPSEAEGLSVALLEAMSCGLAPLLTDVGGAREVVTHQENGWIIPPGDRTAMIEGFQMLFGDRRFLSKFGQAARRRVAADFSVQFAAQKLQDLYFDLARGN